MTASAFDASPLDLDDETAPALGADAQLLVLAPLSSQPDLAPILLDRPKITLGWDVECSVQLPDAGIHAQHAIILREKRNLLVKAWDPRTWLNGVRVAEAPLYDGDLLRIGPIEFRVRAASPDELLRQLPAPAPADMISCASDAAEPLALRRARLSAIRARLNELHDHLQIERERLHAERACFEAERREFQREIALVAAAHETPCRTQKAYDADADRLNRLLGHKPPMAAFVPPPAVPQNRPDEQAHEPDSIADYMERLLGRMRAAGEGGVTVVAPATGPADHGSSTWMQSWAAGPDDPEPEAGTASASADGAAKSNRRARPSAAEIRAGVSSLREIANLSARTAVASHGSRKHRQSVAVTFPLMILSFLLAGLLYVLGGSEDRFYSQAFGTVMLGAIVLIELAHSLWKKWQCDRILALPANRIEPDTRQSPPDPLESDQSSPTDERPAQAAPMAAGE